MPVDAHLAVHLKDYQPTNFIVSHVELHVILDAELTIIQSRLHLTPRPGSKGTLMLDGEDLTLVSIAIDGRMLTEADYIYAKNKLTIHAPPPQAFSVEVTQGCNPTANSKLSGLYLSNGTYCTQMEAEGFRRFAFMYDRPDVMATYTVRIDAPISLPVLLCNGNLVSSTKSTAKHRHVVVWHDPHPKPTYLFALVAGDLAGVDDSFTTSEGRHVSLGIHVEKGKEDRCAWAMQSLKASMLWDEERFGRCYDLDVFNIVAVSDFNMGAMENKGLNIFNDKYILARPDTATDNDYMNIERIIAHEYFHNWTGNRITCRDWFQLCLKEGLTVFRDQEFISDVRSRAVKRIEDVKVLRARQFPEDQGPLAHAVRPTSYIEINNFYTPTIYEKAAEICRMLLTMLGREGFHQGTDVFFDRHDGEAATVEDFLACMADASGRDFTQFARWFAQAGTPIVTVKTSFDEAAQEFQAIISQHTPDTPGQGDKEPLHMPLALGLLDNEGRELPLLTRENAVLHGGILELTTSALTLTFRNIVQKPVLSINRSFSSPVILNSDATDDDLLLLMSHDSDSFNRWEAAQTCARRLLQKAYRAEQHDVQAFAEALKQSLKSASLDNAFKALMLQLPAEAEIAATLARDVDADRLHQTHSGLFQAVALHMAPQLRQVLDESTETDVYSADTKGTARRSLRLAALKLLSHGDAESALSVAQGDFNAVRNMTLEAGALGAVLHLGGHHVDAMLDAFYQRHAQDHLLVDKWFMLAAAKPSQNIEALTRHPGFNFKIPNRVNALIGGFTSGNPAAFHAADGSGYEIVANVIIFVNALNPQVASRLATSFRSWNQYDRTRREQSTAQMRRILATPGCSKDVFEIISRTLA